MPTEVILPRVDMDMTEAMIAAWHVGEGDEVREGTLIFEIETSKATMEIDAPASGFIRQISASVGQMIPVGTPVAWIYAEGEALQEHGAPASGSGPDAPTLTALQAEVEAEMAPDLQADDAVDIAEDHADHAVDEPDPLRATPAARRLAREYAMKLVDITGSGPHGRIAAQDVQRAKHERGGSNQQVRSDEAGNDSLHSVWLHRGTGDPVVLLHGFAADSASWRPFARALTGTHGVEASLFALDLPGHGRSSTQAAGSLDAIVAAVEATLRAAGIERSHLVGHSFGAAVALATSARASRIAVRSLTLLAPAGLGPEINGPFIHGVTHATSRNSLVPWLKQLFADPSRIDEGFIASAEQQLLRPALRDSLADMAAVFFPDGTQSLDLRHLLDALTMPVRVVWGRHDRIVPVRHAEGLPGRVALHRFADVGHLPHVEAQNDVAALVANQIAGAAAHGIRTCAKAG